MGSRPFHAAVLGTLLLFGTSSGQGFAQTGQPRQGAIVGEAAEVRATVETVDLTAREVLLRGEDGGLITVWVGPEVWRLDELKPTDKIVVRYTEALAVRMARPDEVGKPPSVETSSTTAGADRPPGAVVGEQKTAIVTIQEIDPNRNLVTFVGPAGLPRRAVLQDPGMQAFARGLKPGDKVNVTYWEAVAVLVEPTRR